MFLFIQIKFKKAFVNDINKLSIFLYISFCILFFFLCFYDFAVFFYGFSIFFSVLCTRTKQQFVFVCFVKRRRKFSGNFLFFFFIFCGRG